MFAATPLDIFAAVINLILQQQCQPPLHVLVVNDMTVLLIVDCNGTLMLIDSHIHGNKGALIAQSVPNQGQQAESFSAWFNHMLLCNHSVGISVWALKLVTFKKLILNVCEVH